MNKVDQNVVKFEVNSKIKLIFHKMSNAIYTTGRANLDRANFPPQETQLSINNSLLSVFVAVQNSTIFLSSFLGCFWVNGPKRFRSSIKGGLVVFNWVLCWSYRRPKYCGLRISVLKKPNKIEPELYSQHCGYLPRLRPNSLDGLSKIKTDKKSQWISIDSNLSEATVK